MDESEGVETNGKGTRGSSETRVSQGQLAQRLHAVLVQHVIVRFRNRDQRRGYTRSNKTSSNDIINKRCSNARVPSMSFATGRVHPTHRSNDLVARAQTERSRELHGVDGETLTDDLRHHHDHA